MGDFELAVKQLGLPACPHCGEMRQLEHLRNLLWSCEVCRGTFRAAPPASVLNAEGFENGLFKVLPRFQPKRWAHD